jgi:hypothetical protein
METLKVLEQKIVALAAIIKELKVENAQLINDKKSLESENKALSLEIVKLVAELEDTQGQLRTMENSILKEYEQNSKEQQLTKSVVDELIKSIDFLVGENQQ